MSETPGDQQQLAAEPHQNTGTHVRLADVAGSRNNLFNQIRIFAATSVLVSHAFPICGQTELEPLQAVIGVSMGYVAVAVFFCLSGFLIVRSWEQRPNLRRFLIARSFRIYPGLWVALLLTVFVLGPLISTSNVSTYFRSGLTWQYLRVNGTLISSRLALPGVFEEQFENAVNGSLWTLPMEMYCYLATALLGVTRIISRRTIVLWASLSLNILHFLVVLEVLTVSHDKVARLISVGSLFASGATFYLFRDRVVLSSKAALAVCLVCVAAMAGPLQGRLISLHLATPYLLLCAGYLPCHRRQIRQFSTDLSYGVYIYAFPIQQLAVALWPNMQWWQNVLFALPLTFGFAWLSWRFIEERSIKLGRRFISNRTTPAATPETQPA